MLSDLIKLFNRDVSVLETEVQLFKQEDNLWRTVGTIKNPAGNLCLHLVGNLNTYIGKNIGHTAYVRNRDAEFALTGIARAELLQKVQETKKIVDASLAKLSEDQLEQLYTEDVLGFKMTNAYFLVHLLAHLSYHVGQINYLRRTLE